MRTDVIKLCRELGLPVVRWPGGNDLGADVEDVLASNRLGAPDRVVLRDRGVIDWSGRSYDFPRHIITLLSFTLS